MYLARTSAVVRSLDLVADAFVADAFVAEALVADALVADLSPA